MARAAIRTLPPGADRPGPKRSVPDAEFAHGPTSRSSWTRTRWPATGAYLDVANLSVSPGHSRLAYAVDTTGDERFTLRVRDLGRGIDLPGEIEGTSYGVAWANDNETIFFTRPDAANRTYQLWRHTEWGPARPTTTLVHEETDERFHLGVDRTKDGAFILLELAFQDHEPKCTPSRPTGRGRPHESSSRAARGSNTRSSTTATRSCSSPTTTPRTSAWWPPRHPIPVEADGPRSSPTGRTSGSRASTSSPAIS